MHAFEILAVDLPMAVGGGGLPLLLHGSRWTSCREWNVLTCFDTRERCCWLLGEGERRGESSAMYLCEQEIISNRCL